LEWANPLKIAGFEQLNRNDSKGEENPKERQEKAKLSFRYHRPGSLTELLFTMQANLV
jgi:hypothetical protein